MSTMGNPLFSATGATVNQPPPNPLTVGTPDINPGNLAHPTTNIGDIQRNVGIENLQTGDLRNQLIPQFAKLFGQYGGQAADFFKQLMTKGSPFYQQRQTEAFTAGTKSNQDAAALARQQAEREGVGATPSGANIAMIGGMNQAGGQSLAEQFLQNLFQNENLMTQGGQGLAQIAAMFNPAQMTGQATPSPQFTLKPTNIQQMSELLGSLFGSSGVSKSTFTG